MWKWVSSPSYSLHTVLFGSCALTLLFRTVFLFFFFPKFFKDTILSGERVIFAQRKFHELCCKMSWPLEQNLTVLCSFNWMTLQCLKLGRNVEQDSTSLTSANSSLCINQQPKLLPFVYALHVTQVRLSRRFIYVNAFTNLPCGVEQKKFYCIILGALSIFFRRYVQALPVLLKPLLVPVNSVLY